MNFEEFVNEALIPMKKYSEDDIKKHISKFMKKEVGDIPRSAVNFYSVAIHNLKKKYSGYDPDELSHEGPADEEYMKILQRVYDKASRKKGR
jgi:hypothetical protein